MSPLLLAARIPGLSPATGRGPATPAWRTAAAKLAVYGATLLTVLTLNFALPRLMPGDPINALQDPDNSHFLSDPATRDRILGYYGLDRPVGEQYLRYLKGIVTGDLGWSIRFGAPVSDLIGSRLPWTLLLVLPGLILAAIVTLVAGAEAGWSRGSRLDQGLVIGATLLRALPVFFLGVLAILVFGVRLDWFPLAGASTPFRRYSSGWDQALDIAHHWVLPAAVLAVEMIGARFLLVRNTMVTVLGEDFMLVARAKGLSARGLRYRHGLRNALLPFVTLFSAQLGFAVTGAIFIETLFAYPGMGRLVFEAVSARDYPLMQGVFLVVAISVLGANVLVDALYGRLDPRTRRR